MTHRFFTLLLGLGLVWGVTACRPSEPTFGHAKTRPAQVQVRDFVLKGQGDRPIRLSDFRGQWVWLFFGFTRCPDICPTTLLELAKEYAPLAASKAVRVLFVSVDHQRDNHQVVAKYARHFHEDFVGATGSKAQVDLATQALGALYLFRTRETGGYDVDHSGNIYVLNPDGQLVATYAHTDLKGGLAKDFSFLAGVQAQAIAVEKAWVRMPPPNAQALAGYLTLHNPRPYPVRILGVQSSQFERVELHETYQTDGGLTGMRSVQQVEVPAHGNLSLEPGGKHLMLIGPKKAFQEGDRIQLSVKLAGGDTLNVTAPVSTQEPG